MARILIVEDDPSIAFGGETALRHVSARFAAGQIHGIVGSAGVLTRVR